MTSKTDVIITMLDEILMRLDRIERLVDFSDEDAPEDVTEAFDKIFGKKIDKPVLSLVKSEEETNVVELKLD
jgi:hypothetical protein